MPSWACRGVSMLILNSMMENESIIVLKRVGIADRGVLNHNASRFDLLFKHIAKLVIHHHHDHHHCRHISFRFAIDNEECPYTPGLNLIFPFVSVSLMKSVLSCGIV